MHANCICVLFQHGLGALLCVPAIFGLLPNWNVHALARLGGLCEVGWEYWDVIDMLIARRPLAFFILLCIHHGCAQLIVIPANLYLEDSTAYYAQVANLQGVALFALIVDLWVKTLDFNKPKEMRIAAWGSYWFCFVVFASRGFLYPYLAYYMVLDIWGQCPTWVLVCSCISFVSMGFFNFLICFDCVERCKKFYKLANDPPLKKEDKQRLMRQATGSFHGLYPEFFLPAQESYDVKKFVEANRSYANIIDSVKDDVFGEVDRFTQKKGKITRGKRAQTFTAGGAKRR
jgi:hypothetical protein